MSGFVMDPHNRNAKRVGFFTNTLIDENNAPAYDNMRICEMYNYDDDEVDIIIDILFDLDGVAADTVSKIINIYTSNLHCNDNDDDNTGHACVCTGNDVDYVVPPAIDNIDEVLDECGHVADPDACDCWRSAWVRTVYYDGDEPIQCAVRVVLKYAYSSKDELFYPIPLRTTHPTPSNYIECCRNITKQICKVRENENRYSMRTPHMSLDGIAELSMCIANECFCNNDDDDCIFRVACNEYDFCRVCVAACDYYEELITYAAIPGHPEFGDIVVHCQYAPNMDMEGVDDVQLEYLAKHTQAFLQLRDACFDVVPKNMFLFNKYHVIAEQPSYNNTHNHAQKQTQLKIVDEGDREAILGWLNEIVDYCNNQYNPMLINDDVNNNDKRLFEMAGGIAEEIIRKYAAILEDITQ